MNFLKKQNNLIMINQCKIVTNNKMIIKKKELLYIEIFKQFIIIKNQMKKFKDAEKEKQI